MISSITICIALFLNTARHNGTHINHGKGIFDEYNQRVSKDYQGASALSVLSFADNVVKGSNPFAFVLLNKILTQQKMRVATPADLERALEIGVDQRIKQIQTELKSLQSMPIRRNNDARGMSGAREARLQEELRDLIKLKLRK